MRSLWLLHELDVPFELIEMPFDLRHTRSAHYLAVHPLGRVPCLTDEGLRLFESGAITQYLCERFPHKCLGRLGMDAERYEWLQWVHYSETIATHAAALVQQHLFIRPEEQSSAVIKLESARLAKTLALIDTQIRNQDHLLASGFSAADISVGYSIHLALRFAKLDKLPGVRAYYERLRSRAAFEQSLPAGWRRPLMWLPELILTA